MTIATLSIEELMKINRFSARRLCHSTSYGEKEVRRVLVGSDKMLVEATPTGIPDSIHTRIASDFSEQERKLSTEQYRYKIGRHFTYYPNLSELKIILGGDFPENIEHAYAFFEASLGGPKDANAYVLGPTSNGGMRGTVVIPVQYYQIDQKRHEELGIKSNQKELSRLIDKIEKERELIAATP